jgi:hypothetical protein
MASNVKWTDTKHFCFHIIVWINSTLSRQIERCVFEFFFFFFKSQRKKNKNVVKHKLLLTLWRKDFQICVIFIRRTAKSSGSDQ